MGKVISINDWKQKTRKTQEPKESSKDCFHLSEEKYKEKEEKRKKMVQKNNERVKKGYKIK